jgi:hypothetical protein
MRMSTPHFTPRIVLRTGPVADYSKLPLIGRVLLLISGYLSSYNRIYMDFLSQGLMNSTLRYLRKSQTKDMNDKILAFASTAAYQVHKADNVWARQSWRAEARTHGHSNHQPREFDTEALVDRSASSIDGRAKGLHITILRDGERSKMQLYLPR